MTPGEDTTLGKLVADFIAIDADTENERRNARPFAATVRPVAIPGLCDPHGESLDTDFRVPYWSGSRAGRTD